MYKYSLMIHDDYRGYDIDLYHTTRFTQEEFEYYYRQSLRPAMLAAHKNTRFRWLMNPDWCEPTVVLHEQKDSDRNLYESVYVSIPSILQIVAKYMMRTYGFVEVPYIRSSACIHFDDGILNQFCHTYERTFDVDAYRHALDQVSYNGRCSASTSNSLDAVAAFTGAVGEIGVLDEKPLTLQEFIDKHGEPTNEYEFAELCAKYDIYKESYGGNDPCFEG